jgi:predicted Ser/Thr protein kinase
MFDRYVTHVSFGVTGEKLRNPLTGQYEDPDERLMREVEALLGSPDRSEQLRHSLISAIAAWAIDHPGQSVDHPKVFAGHLKRLREAVFAERRGGVAKLCRDVVVLVREEGAGLTEQQTAAARAVVSELEKRFGYDESSAADAALALVRERFADLLH